MNKSILSYLSNKSLMLISTTFLMIATTTAAAEELAPCKKPDAPKLCEQKKKAFVAPAKRYKLQKKEPAANPQPLLQAPQRLVQAETRPYEQQHIVTIDQRQYNVQSNSAELERLRLENISLRRELNERDLELFEARRKIKVVKHKFEQDEFTYKKREYRLVRHEHGCEHNACEMQTRCCDSEGGEGFYLGLVLGYGPDGVKRYNDSEPEFAKVKQQYSLLGGLRLMGVSKSGYAVGVEGISNRSILVDFNLRVGK